MIAPKSYCQVTFRSFFTCPRVGDKLHVLANNGSRPCAVLARDAVRALIEYELPNGTTRLCWVPTSTIHQKVLTRIAGARPLRYTSVPMEWLRRIRDGKVRWKGLSFRGKMPTVVQMIAKAKSKRPLDLAKVRKS